MRTLREAWLTSGSLGAATAGRLFCIAAIIVATGGTSLAAQVGLLLHSHLVKPSHLSQSLASTCACSCGGHLAPPKHISASVFDGCKRVSQVMRRRPYSLDIVGGYLCSSCNPMVHLICSAKYWILAVKHTVYHAYSRYPSVIRCTLAELSAMHTVLVRILAVSPLCGVASVLGQYDWNYSCLPRCGCRPRTDLWSKETLNK